MKEPNALLCKVCTVLQWMLGKKLSVFSKLQTVSYMVHQVWPASAILYWMALKWRLIWHDNVNHFTGLYWSKVVRLQQPLKQSLLGTNVRDTTENEKAMLCTGLIPSHFDWIKPYGQRILQQVPQYSTQLSTIIQWLKLCAQSAEPFRLVEHCQ